MTKRQGDGQRPREQPPVPERGGADPVKLATLAGVVALLTISLLNWRTVDRVDKSLNNRLGKLETRIGQVADRIDKLPAQPARQGPDPNRVYPIKTDGAPVQGPVSAPVTIAEFSDFQ